MRKHIIPQEFNQSDKIGKITMPQAMVLAVGAFLFVIIVISFNFFVSIAAFFPIALVTFVFMFFRVNKMPLYEFLMVYLVYSGTPKLLIYRSDNVKAIEDEDDGIEFLEHVKVEKTVSSQQESKLMNTKKEVQKMDSGNRIKNRRPSGGEKVASSTKRPSTAKNQKRKPVAQNKVRNTTTRGGKRK